jgi:hypothetical protein
MYFVVKKQTLNLLCFYFYIQYIHAFSTLENKIKTRRIVGHNELFFLFFFSEPSMNSLDGRLSRHGSLPDGLHRGRMGHIVFLLVHMTRKINWQIIGLMGLSYEIKLGYR